MSTPSKYHPSGRLYTAKEYRDRKHALRPDYLLVDPRKPYNTGRNAAKRVKRTQRLVWRSKSLTQLRLRVAH